ncbi:hypothetical protein [Qipengyuania gaetbuli]|uniref:hypothetical protein n=1 Tax=Qipengyuania gaetbuli TaxID=266952 RepID=UPI001CFE2951|nr:hypothetical protein [Qipengyuania gaetbuli]
MELETRLAQLEATVMSLADAVASKSSGSAVADREARQGLEAIRNEVAELRLAKDAGETRVKELADSAANAAVSRVMRVLPKQVAEMVFEPITDDMTQMQADQKRLSGTLTAKIEGVAAEAGASALAAKNSASAQAQAAADHLVAAAFQFTHGDA